MSHVPIRHSVLKRKGDAAKDKEILRLKHELAETGAKLAEHEKKLRAIKRALKEK